MKFFNFLHQEKVFSKEQMLENLRKERPEQVINEVLSFEKNKYGFYDVVVDMEHQFLETRIKHVHQRLPYPYREYEKLSEEKQIAWRWE